MEESISVALPPAAVNAAVMVACVVGYVLAGGVVAGIAARLMGISVADFKHSGEFAVPVIMAGCFWPLALPVTVVAFIASRIMSR